jgi:hypothetical protein
MSGSRMTPEAKALLKKIEELRDPPYSMTLREISAKLGESEGRVCGLYYRNLSKKRFDRPDKHPTPRTPSAPRRLSWETANA